MFEERSVAVALPESTILGDYVHELSQDDSAMDCHAGNGIVETVCDARMKERTVPVDLHNSNGVKKRKSYTEEGANSFKTICGSPSFSEMTHTTVDETEVGSAPRSESKLEGILCVGGSGGSSGRRGSRKGLGLVFSLDGSRASASPMSSNGTDNSSVEGDAMLVVAEDASAVPFKMEVSYSPAPSASAANTRAASEEASLLMELAESGRKSARSNSFYANDQIGSLASAGGGGGGGSPTVGQLAAAAAAATAPIGTADEGDSTLSNLLLLRNMPTASLASPVRTRQRSSTFSVAAASTYPVKARHAGARADLSALSPSKTPMAALTWLASMEDDTLAVANSLFELSGAFSLPSSAYKAERDEDNDAHYYDSEGDAEPYYHHNMDLLLPGEEQLPGLRRSAKLSHKGVAVPFSANHNIVSRGANGSVTGVGRARSYSMTNFDRSAVSNTHQLIGQHSIRGASRNSDPLSKALKKFSDKGSVSGLGEGYIGIYSPEDRKERIRRFLEKRKQRMWTKKVKYDVRKNFADSRVRVKGRFVKKEEEEGATPPSAHKAAAAKKGGNRATAAAAAEAEEEEDDDYYYSD